jgi:heparin binding hemagglutinin HbhA
MAFSAPEPGDPRAAEPDRTEPDPTGVHPRSPLLAVLGAGDAAAAAVTRAVADALAAATSRQRTVQQRVADLPTELDELRARLSGDDLRRALESYRAQAERAYAELAGRGEHAWGRLREQPRVRRAITTLEAYTDGLDARVDGLVDDAQDAAARAFAAARATGDQAARTGRRFTDRTAGAVVDASAATADAVEEAGTATAETIEAAGPAPRPAPPAAPPRHRSE